MRAVDEFVRINKIEGNVFMSFDLDEMRKCDTIACGALKLDCPEFVLPVLFDNSTTVATIRYSVPENFTDIEDYMDEFEIGDVLIFYDKLLKLLDECGDWYLIPSGFCFEEKHVYVDVRNHALKLMYIPDTAEKFNVQDIKHLLISMLEKCNEASGGNIQLQLYKYFYKPKFNLNEFRKIVDNYLTELSIKVVVEAKMKQQVEGKKKDDFSKNDSMNESGKKAEQPELRVADNRQQALKENVQSEKDNTGEEEMSPRFFYTPKVNRSQLSQEEIEEMVKSIYNNKSMEDNIVPARDQQQQQSTEQATPVNEEETVYGPKDFNKNSNGGGKKKNLFDNVFPAGKGQQPQARAKSASSGHHAMLKSISVHARYDLPKQIDILLENDRFVIGRATRTGEPTGANYEFSSEITPVSRLHAQISVKDDAYYIEDLGSSNGTFLNGTKLEANKPYLIEDGDKIAFAIAFSKNSIEYAFVE